MGNLHESTLKEMLKYPNKNNCKKVKWILNIPT